MKPEIIVAAFSFLGTLVGTVSGIVTSAKLTNYRIQQLEKKVDKHNNFAERIPVLEEKLRIHSALINNFERNEIY